MSSASSPRRICWPPAVTVDPDGTSAEAARIMAVRGVKRLPVVDAEGKLRGIVSRGDLLKVFGRGRSYGSMSSTSRAGRLGVRGPGGPYPSRSIICT